MNNVNTKGLMLGMLAIGGLIAGGAMFTTEQAYAQSITVSPVNAAAASNSDDDTVTQANAATVKQESETKCKADVDDNDFIQGGLVTGNTNTAANDCDTTQTSGISQTNTNTDNDVQTARAEACQALGLLLGANVCGTSPPEEEDMVV